MRVVGGEFGGRRLVPPADRRVRPTADRVREAWMSILAANLPGARVLDLFAGSGALGLEALSRGAASAAFVELAPRSLAALRTNIDALGAGARAVVHRADALRFIQRLSADAYDVAFADPPYGTGLAERVASAFRIAPFAGILSIEHSADDLLPGGESRRYGDTALTFFRAP
ncbi:MAG TPA: 16S rRNA (guanine(966)-N(2))-methyltransferase RsmD [Gemmatimonadales bacterium]|nr:16S rRNA (guanine(966)-N(2))-methyltransferase RsmD [Gemmatimonadales bacterium]